MATAPTPQDRTQEQLTKDRWIALATLIITLLLLALMIAMLSLGEGSSQPVDYWHVMP